MASRFATGSWDDRLSSPFTARWTLWSTEISLERRTTLFAFIEFTNGALGFVENSWARRGGMDDRIEVYGEAGLTYANLLMGNALTTYSENGYGYAAEKVTDTRGWSFRVFEELWNYGVPQEMAHFARCVRGKEEPRSTGEDGLIVLGALYAEYASAGEGGKVNMPFRAAGVRLPVDLWLKGSSRS